MECKSNDLSKTPFYSQIEEGLPPKNHINSSFESFINRISLTVFNKLVMNQYLEFHDFHNLAQVSKFINVKMVKPTIASWDASFVNPNRGQIRALWRHCRKKTEATETQENLKETTALYLKAMRHTRSLDLISLISYISTPVMALIVEGCSEIVELTLDMVSLEDNCIYESSKNLQNLKKISFYHCLNINNYVGAFALAHVNLTSIDCSNTELTDQSATIIFENLHQLIEINLGMTKITSQSASIITKYPKLKVLQVCDTKIDSKSIMSIVHSCGENLKNIDIKNTININNEVITSIANKCLSVEYIGFSLGDSKSNDATKITDEPLILISQNCPKLTSLYASNHISLTDRAIIALSHCHQLTTLSINNLSMVTDTSIEIITQACPLLRYLDLAGLKHLTPKAFNSIAYHCKSVISLCILNTNINDNDLFIMTSRHPQMKYLALGNLENLTDIGINAIANHCFQLSILKLDYNSDGENTPQISEKAIANLSNSLKSDAIFVLPKIFHEQIHKIKPNLSLFLPRSH